MKKNIFYIAIIIVIVAIFALLYFYNTSTPKTLAVCPEDFLDTDSGNKEETVAMDKWIADFRNKNPNGSIVEVARVRYQFYVENECTATLQKLFEAKADETETEEEKIMRETIQEEMRKQQMKNIIEALKEDESKQ